MGFAKTALLMAAMTALFMACGFLLGGEAGMVLALVVAAGMNLFAFWNSDALVLRMHGARQIGPEQAPQLFRMVERLARAADLPMPKVFIIEQDQPNAFATGRSPSRAAVAATTGLLRSLSHEEIAGVMAHELAHVKNRDTLIMTLTATLAGAIGMLAQFALFFGNNRNNPLGLVGALLVMLLAPIGAAIVQFAISRSREYQADRLGAEICGQPLALAGALAKIERLARGAMNEPAERNPATAHMFIINPLNGRRMDSLFSTHPNTANRIAALEALAGRPAGPWGSRGARQ